MKFRLSEPAAYDIRRITDQIALDDPDRAEVIADKLQIALRAIGSAFLCPTVPKARTPGLRKKTVRPYVILFQLVGNEAWVLRVAHERSDWMSLV